jgi:hypothetical protein
MGRLDVCRKTENCLKVCWRCHMYDDGSNIIIYSGNEVRSAFSNDSFVSKQNAALQKVGRCISKCQGRILVPVLRCPVSLMGGEQPAWFWKAVTWFCLVHRLKYFPTWRQKNCRIIELVSSRMEDSIWRKGGMVRKEERPAVQGPSIRIINYRSVCVCVWGGGGSLYRVQPCLHFQNLLPSYFLSLVNLHPSFFYCTVFTFSLPMTILTQQFPSVLLPVFQIQARSETLRVRKQNSATSDPSHREDTVTDVSLRVLRTESGLAGCQNLNWVFKIRHIWAVSCWMWNMFVAHVSNCILSASTKGVTVLRTSPRPTIMAARYGLHYEYKASLADGRSVFSYRTKWWIPDLSQHRSSWVVDTATLYWRGLDFKSRSRDVCRDWAALWNSSVCPNTPG